MTTRAATALGIIAILFWSLSVGLTRSLSESLGAYYAGAAIYSISAFFVWLFLGKPQVRGQSATYLWGCGLLFTIYMVCFALAIGLADNRQQVLEIGLINYLWPSLTLVLAIFIQKINAKWWIWLGMICAFSGIVWVISGGEPSSLNMSENIIRNPLAYGLAFIAAFAWALYSNLVRLYGQGKGALALFLLCTAIVLWFVGWLVSSHSITFSFSAVIQLLTMGISTSLGYLCWDKAMKQGNVTLVAAFSYFTPLTSLIVASIWLNTSLSDAFVPGIMLVIAGSLLCWSACRK